MNSGELMVLGIVIVVMASGIIRRYLRMQEKRPQEDPEYRNRINALEHRVQTLERIVTDKGYDLKREFDQL